MTTDHIEAVARIHFNTLFEWLKGVEPVKYSEVFSFNEERCKEAKIDPRNIVNMLASLVSWIEDKVDTSKLYTYHRVHGGGVQGIITPEFRLASSFLFSLEPQEVQSGR